MYSIHIVCHENDYNAGRWLYYKLKWYYTHRKQYGTVNITLNSSAYINEPLEKEFLIILCSLNTVDDGKISEAISRFRTKEQAAHIIPYVIGGQPHAADIKNECIPRILTELSGSELLAVNSIELGKRTAFHRIIAAIHGIPLNILEQRDKRQRIRRWVSTGLLIAAFLAYSSYSEYTASTHTEYYRSYTYSYGIPVGIDRLNFAERIKCDNYYIFRVNHTTTPLSIKRVGNPPAVAAKTPDLQEYYDAVDTPVIHFSYHTDGTPDAAVHTESDGKILFVINYLADSKIADFSQLPNSENPYFLSLDGEQTEYSRCAFEYDENGSLADIRYLTNSREY